MRQGNSHQLEQTLWDFNQGKYDILLASTIIESGIDIFAIKDSDRSAHISNIFDKSLTLSDISMHSGMSEKYFCAFFKKMTNKKET